MKIPSVWEEELFEISFIFKSKVRMIVKYYDLHIEFTLANKLVKNLPPLESIHLCMFCPVVVCRLLRIGCFSVWNLLCFGTFKRTSNLSVHWHYTFCRADSDVHSWFFVCRLHRWNRRLHRRLCHLNIQNIRLILNLYYSRKFTR